MEIVKDILALLGYFVVFAVFGALVELGAYKLAEKIDKITERR